MVGYDKRLIILSYRQATFTAMATEGPVSVTTLEGLNAQFHCAGSGSVLVWAVHGLSGIEE